MAGLRQQTRYAPNVFPSPSASNIILSLFVWHSALSVQHIEATDRKRGSWICLEFPFFFLHLTRLPSRLSLKLTIQISLFLSEGSRLWFETWGWEQSCVSRYLPNVKYLPSNICPKEMNWLSHHCSLYVEYLFYSRWRACVC